MKRHLTTLLMAAVLTVPSTSWAQKNEALARDFFLVAKQAANQNRFGDAIRALDLAYKHSGNVKVLAHISRTAKQQYRRDGDRQSLARAVQSARRYLELAPADQKRLQQEARTTLAELEPKLAKLDEERAAAKKPPATGPPDGEAPATETPDGEAPETPPPRMPAPGPAPKPAPRLPQAEVMASSPTPNAFIELDGKLGSISPLIAKVAPGVHVLRITAEGYHPLERRLSLEDGQIMPLDLGLKAKPARVTVSGTEGATLWIDGQQRGVLPMPAPIELSPGQHFVAVTDTGHTPFSQMVIVGRDDQATVVAELGTTGQRYAAWATLGAGAGSVVAGAVLTGLSVDRQNEALAIEADKESGGIAVERVPEYDAARAERDRFRAGAIASFSIGAAALALGTALFVLDDATVTKPLRQDDDDPPGDDDDAVEIGFAPIVGPGIGAATLTLGF